MLIAKKENKLQQNEMRTKKYRGKNKKSKVKVKMRLKLFLFSFVALGICLLILLRYAYITQLKYDIAKIDTQIEELNKEKQELIVELETIKDSEIVEKNAKAKLGMIYPTEDQVVYISVGDESIENQEKIAKEKNNNFIFLKAFRNVVNKMVNFIN
ncbi:cell division protein FtsL [Thermohalobacter berrensis]|uniref:Cell division protein FtsL n=1 Tax=Thermohalobacter berrensis TaxID=99594 RepID=A0A419T9Y3_9FIRM|nr:cell division protein FtsL [Thermohalobacter berrensis]RKD34294.1 cell division protein FtsL [Thermohalobacter berrensis]